MVHRGGMVVVVGCSVERRHFDCELGEGFIVVVAVGQRYSEAF